MNPTSDISTILQAAMQAHQSGEQQVADKLYSEILQRQPDHVQALRLRGILARERGDIGTSQHLLAELVAIAPDDASALSELALSYMAAGLLDEASAALQEALRIKPEASDALINLGAVMQQRGHIRAAIECYRSALQVNPADTQVRCNLAKALSDAGDSDAALQECGIAREHAPGGEAAWILATEGAVFIDQELWSKARITLDEARNAGNRDDMMLVNYALACARLGDAAAAEQALHEALALNAYNARATADLANVMCMAGKTAMAINLCEAFLNRFPGERLVLGAYALALNNAGKSVDAAHLVDCRHLVQVFEVDCPNEFESLAQFNARLTQELREDNSLLTNPVSKATYGGDQTGELDFTMSQALASFKGIVETCVPKVVDYYRQHGLDSHPVMAPAFQPQSLRAWGTLLRAGGRQTSHMHPIGWLSGVYYTHLPQDMSASAAQAGWLEFNRPPDRLHCQPPTRTESFEPREGRLIIFPSWFWHQTLPFTAADERISIAFDVVPTASLRMV